MNELRGAPVAVQLQTDIKQGPGVGTGVGVGVGAGNEAGIPIRSMITSNAQGGSGGINTAAYSRMSVWYFVTLSMPNEMIEFHGSARCALASSTRPSGDRHRAEREVPHQI